MAVIAVNNSPIVGQKYSHTTASSADWSSVGNNTYFYDLTDKLVYYKDSSGNMINTYAPYLINSFTPTNGQTVFTLSQASNSGYYFLTLNGLTQERSLDYTVSGTTLTWLNADFTLTTSDKLVFYYK